MDDHVHLLAVLPTTVTIAALAKRAKGASSHFLGERIGGPEGFRWQRHYGAFTVSHSDRLRVARYVAGQREHHASGALWPAAERCYIDTPTRGSTEPNPDPCA